MAEVTEGTARATSLKYFTDDGDGTGSINVNIGGSLPAVTGGATEVKQDSQITQETAISDRIGAINASPASNTVQDRLKTANTNLVNLLTQIVLAAGENHLGEVGGKSFAVSVTPTVESTPDYSAGDTIGGIQTITGAARSSGKPTVLQELVLIDKANQKIALDVLFFDSSPSTPSTGATTTENSAFQFGVDISKFIARVPIAATDYVTINSIGIADLKNIGAVMVPSGSANLFAVVVAGGTINLASTSDYIFRYKFFQD